MWKQFYADFPYVNMAITGQILFLAIFAGAVIWVFRKGSKGFYEQLAALPLEGKEKTNE